MVYQLGPECWFPPADSFREDGLVAIGGDLSPDRLLLAYERGIFPWSAPEDPLLWWSPDPRAVVRPADVKVSKSMRSILNKGQFTIPGIMMIQTKAKARQQSVKTSAIDAMEQDVEKKP